MSPGHTHCTHTDHFLIVYHPPPLTLSDSVVQSSNVEPHFRRMYIRFLILSQCQNETTFHPKSIFNSNKMLGYLLTHQPICNLKIFATLIIKANNIKVAYGKANNITVIYTVRLII